MPRVTIKITTQQLIDALGIDIQCIHEVSQNFEDRLCDRLYLLVDADWTDQPPYGAPCGHPPPIYDLEDVRMRIRMASEESR